MAFGRRQALVEKPQDNPFAPAPKKAVEPEEIGVNEIFGDSVTKHFEAPNFGSTGISLYPVAGGVGLSTLIRHSQGALKEEGVDTVCESVILVTTTAAEHLLKAQNLLRTGTTPEGQHIIGLVLVEDRPKISKEGIQEAKKTLRMAKHSWGIPYVADFREPRTPGKLPYRFRKAVTELVKTTAA